MNIIEIYDTILSGEGHFTTREIARATGTSVPQTCKALAKLAGLGKIAKIRRGRWVLLSKTRRLRLPELLAGAPAYCTAHTALAHHGMIGQIPDAIYAATTGRGRKAATPFGAIRLHRVAKPLFKGWQTGKGGEKIAGPEKALVDFFYLGAAGHPHFKSLPEVDIPEGFSWEKALRFAGDIPNRARKTAVARKLAAQRETCAITASQDSAEM